VAGAIARSLSHPAASSTVTTAFYRRHADHRYSFTNCTSFIVMRELKISDALTTDRHFGEAEFRMLLP